MEDFKSPLMTDICTDFCSMAWMLCFPEVPSNSFIQLCKELQEMALLVDATTPLFDVEQAHLSFLRQSDEADSGMLSLRRLVRPTDWGTVQAQLREFALADESTPTHRNVLKMKFPGLTYKSMKERWKSMGSIPHFLLQSFAWVIVS